MVKALFFDIDGTLIDPATGKIPASTLTSLACLRRKGIKLFVATGRVPAMVTFLEDLFPFDGFLTLNGQLGTTRDGTVLHRMAHHPEDIRKLVELVKADPFPCLIIEEKESFYVTPSPLIQQHFAWAKLPGPGAYDLSRLDQFPVLQFLAYIPFQEAVERLAPLEHIEITTAGGTILDVIPQGGGKEIGIQAVADYYGFTREEIMVFGDGNNDLRMLSWAGTSVALGNGTPAAKAAATYTTAPVGEDGVQKALLHFGLLEKSQIGD